MFTLTFSGGRSTFLDGHPSFTEPTAKIFVKVTLPGLQRKLLAQLDTGAAYSILEADVARELGLFALEGDLRGRLMRVPLKILAEEGESLVTDATFFVSSHWHGGTFLGYTGLLDKLRIALDSPANQFYFGEES